MDGQLLSRLYHRPAHSATPNCVYSDGLIALLILFAAAGNKSLAFAARASSWPLGYRHLRLPSASQLRRRACSRGVLELLKQMHEECLTTLIPPKPPGASGTPTLLVDAKPLVISNFSHDPDAHRGYACGSFSKGYRLHAIVDAASSAIVGFDVSAMNAAESTVMRSVMKQTDLREALIRGDAGDDDGELYAIAAEAGGRFIAPRRKPGSGVGKNKIHPHRLEAIALLEGDPAARKIHSRKRAKIERVLGNLVNCVALFALPPHVRRLARVQRHVLAKIVLYHQLLCLRVKAA
jgi:hypothetical protein